MPEKKSKFEFGDLPCRDRVALLTVSLVSCHIVSRCCALVKMAEKVNPDEQIKARKALAEKVKGTNQPAY